MAHLRKDYDTHLNSEKYIKGGFMKKILNRKTVSFQYKKVLATMAFIVSLPIIGNAAPYLSSISVYPSPIPSGGQATVNIRVSESCPAGGCLVNLYSQKPSYLPLPSSAVIPEGASTVGVVVQAAENNTTSSISFSISGNMNGVYASSFATIAKAIVGPQLKSFTVGSNNYVYAGQELKTSIALTDVCQSASGCAVKVSSNNSLIPYPSSIIIPGGSMTADFSVLAGNLKYAEVASLSASFNGVSKNMSLYIFPALGAPNSDGSYNMIGYGLSTRTGTGSVTKSMNISMAKNNMLSHISNFVSRQCQAAIPGGVLVKVGSPVGYGEFKRADGELGYTFTQNLKCKNP